MNYIQGLIEISITDRCDLIIDGNILELVYDAYSSDSSFSETIEIKFCPMCGTELSTITQNK